MTEFLVTYLDLISLFHFIVAGIAGLFSCLPLFNLFIGMPMLKDIPYTFLQHEYFSQQILAPFIMFILLPTGMAVIGWMFAIAVALNGYYIKNRIWLKYCMVISGIETIFTPLGTILGAFSLVLLTKPNIRMLFDQDTKYK